MIKIALGILIVCLLPRLMIGFMIVSAFLSMWMSNTATTAMMLPIARAVLQQLKATEARADEQDFQAEMEDSHEFELESRQMKQDQTNPEKPDAVTELEDSVCTYNCQLDRCILWWFII